MRIESGRILILLLLAGAVTRPVSAAPTYAPGTRQPTTTQVGEQTAAADADKVIMAMRMGNYSSKQIKELYGQHGDAWRDADSRSQPQAMWLLAVSQLENVAPVDQAALSRRLRGGSEAGYAPALLTIGDLFRHGEKRYDRAMEYFLAAADAKEPAAFQRVGEMHILGQGVPKNVSEGASWYRKGAEQGHPASMWLFGLMLLRGEGVTPDIAAGVEWLHKSADAGDPHGMALYGIAQFDDALAAKVERDPAKGVSWVQRAAEANDVDAMFQLAALYSDGKHLTRDLALAEKWVRRAAEAGHPQAKELLAKAGITSPTTSTADVSQTNPTSQPASPGENWRDSGAQLAGLTPPTDPAGAAIRYLSTAASDGNVQAMVELASRIEQGLGVRADPAKAYEWYLQAARLNSPIAMVHVAQAQFDGKVVPRNEKDGTDWLRQAAELGNADAMCALGKCYNAGRGVSKDLAEGFKWLLKAADLNDANAMVGLADAYLHGDGVKIDSRKALEYSQRAAAAGHPIGLYTLGTIYEKGLGVPRDVAQAVPLFRRAAEMEHLPSILMLADLASRNDGVAPVEEVPWLMRATDLGDPSAMRRLGVRYLSGQAVPRDVAKGITLTRQAAGAGDGPACFSLAQIYEQGLGGTQKDLPTAINWYLRGTSAGDANCMNEMGRLNQTGSGMPQDQALAVEWYRRSARAGCALAKVNLGTMYVGGVGVDKDLQEALRMFLSAAQANDSAGMLQLGLMYLNGIGVPKDNTTATVWIQMSARRGNEQAQEILKSNGLSW